ncbi:MAG: hypothetical protein RL208_735 [Pseudomonadota bacterium]
MSGFFWYIATEISNATNITNLSLLCFAIIAMLSMQFKTKRLIQITTYITVIILIKIYQEDWVMKIMQINIIISAVIILYSRYIKFYITSYIITTTIGLFVYENIDYIINVLQVNPYYKPTLNFTAIIMLIGISPLLDVTIRTLSKFSIYQKIYLFLIPVAISYQNITQTIAFSNTIGIIIPLMIMYILVILYFQGNKTNTVSCLLLISFLTSLQKYTFQDNKSLNDTNLIILITILLLFIEFGVSNINQSYSIKYRKQFNMTKNIMLTYTFFIIMSIIATTMWFMQTFAQMAEYYNNRKIFFLIGTNSIIVMLSLIQMLHSTLKTSISQKNENIDYNNHYFIKNNKWKKFTTTINCIMFAAGSGIISTITLLQMEYTKLFSIHNGIIAIICMMLLIVTYKLFHTKLGLMMQKLSFYKIVLKIITTFIHLTKVYILTIVDIVYIYIDNLKNITNKTIKQYIGENNTTEDPNPKLTFQSKQIYIGFYFAITILLSLLECFIR